MNHLKYKVDEHHLTPPEGIELLPCPSCFLVPAAFVIDEPTTASRFKARSLGDKLEAVYVRLRPCDHTLSPEEWTKLKKHLGIDRPKTDKRPTKRKKR